MIVDCATENGTNESRPLKFQGVFLQVLAILGILMLTVGLGLVCLSMVK